MTIQSIIDAILAYHPDIGDGRTCDVAVGAGTHRECTGIVISIAPTVPVLLKAEKLGANFILVHEPTFYSGYDDDCGWLAGDMVYMEKQHLLEQLGITIFRDHDHMHAHRPDGIFHYMLKQLGWEDYLVPEEGPGFAVRLPRTRLGDLCGHIRERFDLDTVRFVGDPGGIVSYVGFCGHLLPGPHTNWSNNDIVLAARKYDVIIAGETVDWTLPLYVYDAGWLCGPKGLIAPGHFVQEEAGMRWAEEWLRPLLGGADLPITFVPTGDIWNYRRDECM